MSQIQFQNSERHFVALVDRVSREAANADLTVGLKFDGLFTDQWMTAQFKLQSETPKLDAEGIEEPPVERTRDAVAQ